MPPLRGSHSISAYPGLTAWATPIARPLGARSSQALLVSRVSLNSLVSGQHAFLEWEPAKGIKPGGMHVFSKTDRVASRETDADFPAATQLLSATAGHCELMLEATRV